MKKTRLTSAKKVVIITENKSIIQAVIKATITMLLKRAGGWCEPVQQIIFPL